MSFANKSHASASVSASFSNRQYMNKENRNFGVKSERPQTSESGVSIAATHGGLSKSTMFSSKLMPQKPTHGAQVR